MAIMVIIATSRNCIINPPTGSDREMTEKTMILAQAIDMAYLILGSRYPTQQFNAVAEVGSVGSHI